MKEKFTVNKLILGGQILFVAFGALNLVPLLTGVNLFIALFTAGFGTFIFQLITKKTIPVFFANSFAFISPIRVGIDKFGINAALSRHASAAIDVKSLINHKTELSPSRIFVIIVII